MITGMEIAACQHMAVPAEVMQHVVNVESGYNPFAIGVVGGQLVRQPQSLGEAIATAQMLDSKGYNFSLGLAQVNRANLSKYGLTTYEQAFDICPNLVAGARILSECYASSGNDWGKSFSCYYSGNFVTGYRDGYVQKIYASINAMSANTSAGDASPVAPIQLAQEPSPSSLRGINAPAPSITMPVDSARYRQAIRSTVLDTAASIGTKALAATGLPVVTSPDAAQSPAASTTDHSANAAAASAQGTPATAPNATAASADVFEPQVRSLGETSTASAVVSAGDGAHPPAADTTPSKTSVDTANVAQGGHDDALVF